MEKSAQSQQAHEWAEAGALLLDVRTPEEFAGGHLPGAVNIPVQELPQRLGEVGPVPKGVVVYCAAGGRSASAAEILKRAGVAQVLNLGPMSAW